MPPLATVKSLSQRGELVWLSYMAEIPIAKVDFNYTTDRGEWKDRHWTTVAVESEGHHKTRTTLPPGVGFRQLLNRTFESVRAGLLVCSYK